jgi:hypothetical protein
MNSDSADFLLIDFRETEEVSRKTNAIWFELKTKIVDCL